MAMKRAVYINDYEANRGLYCDNRISNRKYTVLNFIPKNLWQQFSRFMNQYFLLIACLQLWPLIAPVHPVTAWGPLIVIFAVSATKEAWDDCNRYLLDKKANEREVWVVRHGTKTNIQAQDIHVGDIVWLGENDEVPCDLVLLGTSDPLGICHVETASLDGETDLKPRAIPTACMGLYSEKLQKIMGGIECPHPDKDIRRFDANLRLFPPFRDNDVCPLAIKNTLLQSCSLRNTVWACGVAVYTGNETKLGMSRGLPEPKLTAMDSMIDNLTGAIFVFQIAVVMALGVAGNIWKDKEARKQWYLQYLGDGPWYELMVIPLRFELLCSIMIPISMKVSLDLVKSLYAKFIDWDEEMVDQETGIRAHALNTAISEDLGQVEYILTDKTGTLTENKMIFRRCFISGIFYGNEGGDALEDAELAIAVERGFPDVIRFLTVMAICNTVIPIESENGLILYKAQSQDEEALVHAAARLHMVYTSKNGNLIEFMFNGSILRFEVLDILEFTSDRKRMSVVVKDCQNGKIMLLSKGADEAILPYVVSGQQTRAFVEAVEQYTRLGLRTLCLAWRKLKEDEYQKWSLMFKEANGSLIDREWRIAVACQQLEQDLELLGVTAIEDRLQDGVPETIGTLRKAGINFWMLTGDKQNTAIQIALSCNLISPDSKSRLLLIDGESEDEVSKSLERVLHAIRITSAEEKDITFVADGWALEVALKHYLDAFTELAMISRTAICCRVTPSQKAQLVELLKSCGYRTLAIGDGGNDVRMIQQAHVGVGISGREGLQAARAADYSIGKFRFLKRLILVHGRYSYNRTALLSLYSFYKSLLICFIQIFFAFISGLSGTSLFNSVSLMAYNVFYTSFPALVSILDKDLSEGTVMEYPEVLIYCRAGRLLGHFAGWFGRALFHAIVVLLISISAYAKKDMEEVSIVALSGCMWLQAFIVALETQYAFHHIMLHLYLWEGQKLRVLLRYCNTLPYGEIWLLFMLSTGLLSAIPSSGMHTVMFRLCKQPLYWIAISLTVVAGMAPILAWKFFLYIYRPSDIGILQQVERMGRPILSLGNIEPPERSGEEDATTLSIMEANSRNPVDEPLLLGSSISSS